MLGAISSDTRCINADSFSALHRRRSTPIDMAEEPKNAVKSINSYSIRKNSFDKKFLNNAANSDVKLMGKTPFTLSIDIPRGAKGFGFSVTWVQPVRVARVVQDSPADHAGLKVGDRIIFISQQNVVKASDKTILKLIKSERNILQLEIYRRGLANISNLTAKDIRQLEGISDSPASSSRYSHQNHTNSEYGTYTPTMMVRADKNLGSRLLTNRIAGFNTPPSRRTEFGYRSGSWGRLNHESHSSIDDVRRQAIYQLVTCEENFTNLTYFGIERYVEGLRKKPNILSSTERIVLFQNIEELVWLSGSFVEKIMEGDLNSIGNSIGAIYQEKILELCGAYQFYCNGINAADALLTSKMLNPSFLQFLQDPPIPSERLDITSFIHRPVEHFREVLLLLQTILAHSETRHADYDPLENVVETMRLYYKDITSTLDLLDPRIGSTATSGNNQITAITTGTTMEDLEQRLVFTKSAKPFKLCEPGRQWVFGSELQKQDGKTMKACWIMLFTDILVFTRVGRDKVLFVTEDPVSVTSIGRAYFNIKKKNTEFRLIVDRPRDNQNALLAGLQKRHRAIVLRAESVELKTMWQSYIQRQVWLLRGHEQSSTVNTGTPGASRKLWQTAAAAVENNQKSINQTPSKKITGTFVLGKKNKSKEPTFGRILPSAAGKRQFLLEFLEGKGRHMGKGLETEPTDWEYDNDPLASAKEEELAKLRQQMMTKKLPNYFEGEYEEFFFDDEDDGQKSSKGSDNITQSPGPIRSNLSTPQRRHKVSPAMKPKKLSFHLPSGEGRQTEDSNKTVVQASVEIRDKSSTASSDSNPFSMIADTVRGSIEKLFQGSPLLKVRGSPKMKDSSSPKNSPKKRQLVVVADSPKKSSNVTMIQIKKLSSPIVTIKALHSFSTDSESVHSEPATDKCEQESETVKSPDADTNCTDESIAKPTNDDTVKSDNDCDNKTVATEDVEPVCSDVDRDSSGDKDKPVDVSSVHVDVSGSNVKSAPVDDSLKRAKKLEAPKAEISPMPVGSPAVEAKKVASKKLADRSVAIIKRENLNYPETKRIMSEKTISLDKPVAEVRHVVNPLIKQAPVQDLEIAPFSPRVAPKSLLGNLLKDNRDSPFSSPSLSRKSELMKKEFFLGNDQDISKSKLAVNASVSKLDEITKETSPILRDKVMSVKDVLSSSTSGSGSCSSEETVIERLCSLEEGSLKRPTPLARTVFPVESKTLGELVPKTPKMAHREIRPTDLNINTNEMLQDNLFTDPKSVLYGKSVTNSPAMKAKVAKNINLVPPVSPRVLKERVQIFNVGERQKVQMTYVESPLLKHKEIKPVTSFSPILSQKVEKPVPVDVFMHRERTASLAEKTCVGSPMFYRKDTSLTSSVLSLSSELQALKEKPKQAINSSPVLSNASSVSCVPSVFPELMRSQEKLVLTPKSSTDSDTKTVKDLKTNASSDSDSKSVNVKEMSSEVYKTEPKNEEVLNVEKVYDKSNEGKVESLEKIEPVVENTCTERKANSETSSGYQSEKASTDSPAVMHKETKSVKSSSSRDEKVESHHESIDSKSSCRTSPKDKERLDKNTLNLDTKSEVKSDKNSKDTSPLPKHKEGSNGKVQNKELNRTMSMTENLSQMTKSSTEAESLAEKGSSKEKRLLRQDSKTIKPSPDRKQKNGSSSGVGSGVVSPKVDTKPKSSPSPAVKAPAKNKDSAKKDVKKPDAGKKPVATAETKQTKAVPTKTADPTKIKSSDKAKKESIKSEKGKETDSLKKSDKPASEKSRESKDKRDPSVGIKTRETKKVSTPKLNNDPKFKDSHDKDADSVTDTIKKSPSRKNVAEEPKSSAAVTEKKDTSGDAVAIASPKKASSEKSKLSEDAKEGRDESTKVPPKDIPVEVVEKRVDIVDPKKEESIKKQDVEHSKNEPAKSKDKQQKSTKPSDDKKAATASKDATKSPRVTDVKTRIRSRLESRTMEGRSREGSPRLKKMCNDTKEFYFDADIEKDYPELVGTPRTQRREGSIVHSAVRRCGSVVENRRCGSFEEIPSISSHADKTRTRDVLWHNLSARKDSFNSHSERDLTPAGKKMTVRTMTKPETAKAGNAIESVVAIRESEPCIESLQTKCPPGSGHCGEEPNVDKYLCYRRDSYNSHTHREDPLEDYIIEVHRTGSGRSQGKEKRHARVNNRNHAGDYEVPHCVIHNHKKTWREAVVYSKQMDYEVSDSSHFADAVDAKTTMEFVIPNGDELGRLGSSLDDMLKCEVWLMNQCGNGELSSAKQSSVSEGNSSTLYADKSAADKVPEGTVSKCLVQKCEPASESPVSEKQVNFVQFSDSVSLEPNRLPPESHHAKSKKGFVAHQKEILEGKGLSKLLKSKAADVNSATQSPQLNSRCDSKLDSSDCKDSSDFYQSINSSMRKDDNNSASMCVNGISENSSMARPLCIGNKSGTSDHIDHDSSVNNSISNTVNHLKSNQVALQEEDRCNLHFQSDEVNHIASTSKGGIYADDLEKPCCSRTLLPNDYIVDDFSLDGDLSDNANPCLYANGMGDDWQSNGNIPALGTPASLKKKSNIKMGLKSMAGIKGGSPNLSRKPSKPLVNSPLAKDCHVEALKSERRQSTGSLLRQDDEKKGRFNLFRRTTSPHKVKDLPEACSGGSSELKQIKDDKEVKPENIKASWFPWRSRWRKALHDCSSLPATPPNNTPLLLPRETITVPNNTRHGSDGDLGSWSDDNE